MKVRVQVPSAELYVRQVGKGEPVLLVHGFPFSSEMWMPVAERLAKEGHRAIVPDLRGLGASTGERALGMETYANDLIAILDALEVTKPLPWVGFSMGGYVTFEAWRRHAGRISALAFVDTRAAADDDKAQAGRRATADRVHMEGSGVVADAMLPKLLAPGAPDALRKSVHRAMADAPADGVIGALLAMASRPDSTGTLRTIKVPTLVIVGEADALTPRADSETIAKGVKGAQLEVVTDAGHLAPVEQPDVVAHHLARWLAPKA